MKPSLTPTIYHDSISLYLEWPNYALRFPFNEAGLSKALKHIPAMEGAKVIPLHPGNIPDRLESVSGKIAKITPATARKREAKSFTAEQKDAAMDIVRRLKIVS